MTDNAMPVDYTKQNSKAVAWAVRTNTKGMDKGILMFMAGYCEMSHECDISQTAIESGMGYCRRAVNDALKRLEVGGFIHTEKNGGKRSPTTGRRMNRYTLMVDEALFAHPAWFAKMDREWARIKGERTDEGKCNTAFNAYRHTAYKAGKTPKELYASVEWYWNTNRRNRHLDKMPSFHAWFRDGGWKLYFERKGKKAPAKTRPSQKIAPTRNQNVG